jgi:hypothetical protein
MEQDIPGEAHPTYDMGSLLNRLLSTEYIPEDIKQDWFILCSDDIILSFHNQNDIKWIMNEFSILEDATVSALSGHEYSTDIERQLRMIRIVFFSRLNRSKDGGERKAQVTQIHMDVAQDQKPDPMQQTSWWSQAKRFVTGG